ncbi:MAG: ferrous iron transporter B [Polyangiaceae bacterium]|nr:ferrous iron transporter B [Polyangiaceae bacterium]
MNKTRHSNPLTIALVGRPNSGKSSLYNALTGENARVGNYPGITVDILEGEVVLPSGARATLVDLPGLYSTQISSASGADEGVAQAFLDSAKTKGERLIIAQVVDATRLALGLRLTRELVALNLPLVVILTHGDVLADEWRNADSADCTQIEKALGAKFDLRALADAVGGPAVLVDSRKKGITKRACLEAFDKCLQRSLSARAAKHFHPASLAKSVLRYLSPRQKITEQIDGVMLHPILGPVIFVGIMAAIFAAVFLVADPITTLMDQMLGLARAGLTKAFGKNLFTSFLVSGVLGGAGTVLAFMPQIVVLTIALELLEASGYLARGAFLTDRLLRAVGLGGRAFLPLLMGHACAVPAISATRVVRDPRERLTTILVIPLMTCSARLPTYGLVLATFFSDRSPLFRSLLFISLYIAGIISALFASWVLRRSVTKGKGLPLVLEMPAYRLPQIQVVARKAGHAARRFLRQVGTTIVVVSMVLWCLLTVPMPGSHAERGIESSVAATIGHVVEPITQHAGFDWRINVGLVGAFGAREVMVGTMGVIYGVENAADDSAPLTKRLREAKKPDGTPRYGVRTACALLAFFVLACQCMSTVVAIRSETSTWRWPAFVVAYTYTLGFAAAVLVYQVGGLLGIG